MCDTRILCSWEHEPQESWRVLLHLPKKSQCWMLERNFRQASYGCSCPLPACVPILLSQVGTRQHSSWIMTSWSSFLSSVICTCPPQEKLVFLPSWGLHVSYLKCAVLFTHTPVLYSAYLSNPTLLHFSENYFCHYIYSQTPSNLSLLLNLSQKHWSYFFQGNRPFNRISTRSQH